MLPKTYWHSCRQFWCSGLCDIFVLFDDFVVNGMGRCNCLLLYSHGGLARGKNIIAFGIAENMGTIDGRLLCLSLCANILVVSICSDPWRSCVWELHNRFTSKINHTIQWQIALSSLSISLSVSLCVSIQQCSSMWFSSKSSLCLYTHTVFALCIVIQSVSCYCILL